MTLSAIRRSPRARSLTALLVATMCLASGAYAQDGAQKIDDARSLLEKWVETRRVLSKEARDFELSKETLASRVDLVRREIEALRGKIVEAEKSLNEADQKKAELAAENEAHRKTTAALADAIGPAEERARDLAARLPDPIAERVKPVTRRLPAKGAETKLTLSDRFLTIVGLLNEVDKFQREVVVRSEVRALPDGSSAEVTAVYPGLGAAYYVDGRGASAGVGTPSANGFVWTAANDIAEAVKKVASIVKNEVPAAFVRLPLKVR